MPTKASATSAAEFSKDQKVLCFHGPLLYEAKILDMKQEDPKDKKSNWKYFVHYKGWKNTWDDWVPETRVRAFNDENRQLSRELKRDMIQAQREEELARRKTTQASKSARKSDANSKGLNVRASEDRGSVAPTRGTKRARDNDVEKVRLALVARPKAAPEKPTAASKPLKSRPAEQPHVECFTSSNAKQEEHFVSRPSVRIPVSDQIKGLLVDDWENITKTLQLVPLPHPHPVTEILKAYSNYETPRRREGSADADILEEVLQGLREYFNKALGRILLYRFERQQWLEVYHRMTGGELPVTARVTNDKIDIQGKEPADVYGAEHLARLLTSMPELIAQTNMDSQSVARLREELTKIANWLGRHTEEYFVSEYEDPGQEYISLMKGV